jgi:GNAT superfamily N-acetyltransferase
MNAEGPLTGIAAECERVLRTLPRWFGIEESIVEYAQNTSRFPTFVVRDEGTIIGFLSLQRHFSEAWDINCIAVDLEYRGKGIGRTLQKCAEEWLVGLGATILQVKTLAESHPSTSYAETRKFYESMGYKPTEVFPTLWAAHLPVLQLIKVLRIEA